MKIVEETPTRLVLKQKSLLGFVICGLFFLVGIYLLLLFPQKDTKSMLISLFFIVFGVAGILFVRFITVILDKSTASASINTRGLLGNKTQTFAFNTLKEIAIEEYVTATNSSTGPRNQLNYNLVFYQTDGQAFPIHLNTPSMITVGGFPVGFMNGRNKTIELGNKIATFVGIPFVDRRPPTLGDVVANVSTVIQNAVPQEQPKTTPPPTTIG